MTTTERNAFNGRAPYRKTRETIIELGIYGVSILDIQEAVNEYQIDERGMESQASD